MKDYEAVFIFRSASSQEEVESKLERYHGIVSRGDGEVTAVEHWGKRQFAYPIQKETSGYYVVSQFSSEPDALPELERILRLDEELLRHLVVLREGELPALPTDLEDEEDEEDEDEDEDGEED